MKVEAARDKLLTNFEVLEHVKETHARYKSQRRFKEMPSHNLERILSDTISYMAERPAGSTSAPQTAENITAFMKELKANEIELERAERLQIINSAPNSLPILFNIVEECDQRFSEDQLNAIIDLSTKYLSEEPIPEVREDED
ncbi:DNA-directed RNA polymerase III subunit RPC9 [Trichomonascus vanleenenianus]|uniref:DNA-directed RNA polymerase III subunit RPC17 n=1 Tax=Trichomonascus vanleenenianus TaxID=2268995 RepID=UPI003ECA53E1